MQGSCRECDYWEQDVETAGVSTYFTFSHASESAYMDGLIIVEKGCK